MVGKKHIFSMFYVNLGAQSLLTFQNIELRLELYEFLVLLLTLLMFKSFMLFF